MTRPDKSVALRRLKSVLGRLPALKGLRHGAQEFEKWHRDVRVAIGNTFGQDSSHLKEFKGLSFSLPFLTDRTTDSQMQDWYARALTKAEVTIQSMIEEVAEYWEDPEANVLPDRVPQNTRRLFIVHGRDAGAKDEVARFLERLELEPIVLAEMPSEGKTIIEKFEAYAEVGYAVVLLTADDSGALKGQVPQPRARQNVIFELGFFIGKLGRERVCALTRGEPEVPSDYAGVAYIPLDSSGAWQMSLIRELKAAGLEVDANKAI